MKTRTLGRQGLSVSEVGLGCMGFTQSYPPYPDRKEAIATLREAVELGVTFFDTAEVYSAFKNEELVGGGFGTGSRQGGHRHEVRIQPGGYARPQHIGTPRKSVKQARHHPQGGGRVAPPFAYRSHRPLLSASGRP